MAASEPPNFSWVAEGRLAGLAMPREPGHYRFLQGQGVRHLVSLSERAPPHHGCCPAVRLHRLRVPDFSPPDARADPELPAAGGGGQRPRRGRGRALPAGARPHRHHAGLLPGESAEDERRRRHPGDPAAAARLYRDAGAGASRDPVLPARWRWSRQRGGL
ncbi:unnamed protein product, partial [Bubo scandiacus]